MWRRALWLSNQDTWGYHRLLRTFIYSFYTCWSPTTCQALCSEPPDQWDMIPNFEESTEARNYRCWFLYPPRESSHIFTDLTLSTWEWMNEWMEFVGPLSFHLLPIRHKHTLKNLKKNLECCREDWQTIEMCVVWLTSYLRLLSWLCEY